ncbi:DUF4190 domain-containing protein [Blastococcus haudaquaticus]|uniref:DUF4190 domain-containing protein n=1 Tax=Blastococcus haudaquaticus TaxID=1938745 RepID=A0A286H150_9ACTN|nr:DUF4190 domain-containing protein [Blastococcus haudaquaticus]SOE01503.1 hypothetical protein SAMN06272739_3207 [Blastococcus haudaquaticus]
MTHVQGSTVQLDPDRGFRGAAVTDVMAILGLVFAVVLFPLGIVFSALGLRNTRRDGTRGRGLALAGMTVSLLVAGTIVLLVALTGL